MTLRGSELIKHKFKLQFVVVTGVIVRGSKVLVGHRNKPRDKFAHGLWQTPGGKVEFGEQPEKALVREVREETGLRIKPITLLPNPVVFLWPKQKPVAQMFVLNYHCRVIGGKLNEFGPEDSEWWWVGKQEFKRLRLTPGTKAALTWWFYGR